jgi:phytoene dehydrogenase-like protein
MTHTHMTHTKNDRLRAIGFGRFTVTQNPVTYDYRFAGPDGAWFTLHREPTHTDYDIRAAKRWLRSVEDVVGISVSVAVIA